MSKAAEDLQALFAIDREGYERGVTDGRASAIAEVCAFIRDKFGGSHPPDVCDQIADAIEREFSTKGGKRR